MPFAPFAVTICQLPSEEVNIFNNGYPAFRATLTFCFTLLALLLAACQQPPTAVQTATPSPERETAPAAAVLPVTPVSQPMATSTVVLTVPPPTVPPPTQAALPLTGTLPPCGQLLPILSNYKGDLVESLDPAPQDLARLQDLVPDAARPALDRILSAPDTVGLAAYRVGQEDQGAYLNARAGRCPSRQSSK